MGIGEYGGRMRRWMDQEEMVKTRVRVCNCPSSEEFPQFKLSNPLTLLLGELTRSSEVSYPTPHCYFAAELKARTQIKKKHRGGST